MRPAQSVPLALLAAATLALSACSAAEPETAAPAPSTLLDRYELGGLTGKQIVDRLDASPEQRPLDLSASVNETEVVLGDEAEEVSVPLPEEEFYVSVAPYVEQTHECYYHSLAGCQGELAGDEVSVTITDSAGEVLVEEQTTTFANGFVGYWLPRDIEGTIEVAFEDYEGSVPFATGAGDPTCITTLQLEPAATR